ncbi:hypothetical protein EVA_14382 [gut metagenome]|uniref:Uncharacterized protein n=1 Tax=gut metagenome TaxID=749906 RepID=J9FRD1_9ZZZZ
MCWGSPPSHRTRRAYRGRSSSSAHSSRSGPGCARRVPPEGCRSVPPCVSCSRRGSISRSRCGQGPRPSCLPPGRWHASSAAGPPWRRASSGNRIRN